MTANPYQAPGADLAGEAVAVLPSHTRPLGRGVLYCVVAPVLVVVIPLTIVSFFKPEAFLIAFFVALVGLVVSTVATLAFALPVVLLLRRRRRLWAGYVCMATLLIGAVAMACLVVEANWISMWADNSAAIRKGLLNGAPIGAGFGLIAGLAMCFGAGIPFRRRLRKT